MSLITTPNMADHDAAYARLIAAHKGLSETQSAALNARLILVLMNHVGDLSVLEEAIALAESAGA
ncbi:DUF2783 domain-containing protein [Mesobacterium sp. TK19101]|uniref:DUF2783 domain-containing protein n=1 Tax=Mesobacterium hydrothermale TaxID=3111907 RepID=A0ABU6HIZ4_9RHOB|nr:DUF2783 domain-containing protein [Mesobacterium sp. TK19101]MEC3861110.1 DUF2783 domain-containing protein [Mesobacterium sp. TK19101]